jgi:hypothetical protein
MATIKQLTDIAEQAGVSLADIVSEVERGGRPGKPYTLVLSFDRMNQLVEFVRRVWAEDEAGVWPGNMLDREFRGRVVPSNTFVVRDPRSTDRPAETRID